MKELSLPEIRQRQVLLLEWFDKFCKDNALRYSLAGGTLLGAVRHGGYIPWDDDIDVMMPRPDYDKFVKLTRDYDSNNVSVFSPIYTPKKQVLPFSYIKVCDTSTLLIEKEKTKKIEYFIYIDVFPIDGFPSTEKHQKKYVKKYTNINLIVQVLFLAKYNIRYGSCWRKILWYCIYGISKVLDGKFILQYIENKLRKIDFNSSEYCGNVFCGYGIKECIHRSAFNITTISFERKSFSCIEGYKEYLTNLYGDYMQLPPKEKQVLCHDYSAYSLD